ncbi:MAG TPA: divalent-cation tolerance protein CutA [Ktedonobacteraceae bacterium]|jgi:periplasmic divalent cation tolerance protein|nr:divalent-cation tolerance protein CutA [Ktedonobacteraceae bacterium]
MTDFLIVYTAIDSRDGAQKIAEAVVGQRLAACCWISGPITSTYWWKEQMEQAEEWVCQIKTRADLYAQVEQVIKTVHTYDEPEIIATPISAGSQSYLDWIAGETGKRAEGIS